MKSNGSTWNLSRNLADREKCIDSVQWARGNGNPYAGQFRLHRDDSRESCGQARDRENNDALAGGIEFAEILNQFVEIPMRREDPFFQRHPLFAKIIAGGLHKIEVTFTSEDDNYFHKSTAKH